jgi:hypothetical protein
MANTYSWRFPTLQAYTHKDGYTDVVYVVHWYYKGECDPSSGSYSYETFGAQEIAPYESGSRPFIPYEELTQETVQSWVEETMGSAKIEQMREGIDKQIANLINPPVAFLSPPWAITPTPTPSASSPEPTPSESPVIPPLGPTPTPTPSA